jgi:hypothetical protein
VPEETAKPKKTADVEKEDAPEAKPYVSSQLALKTWSVIDRFLHEGTGIVTLHKAWDSRNQEFVVFPSYAGQDPDALKPDVWMAWRHVLKPALDGHTYIRNYAKVVDAVPVQSVGALRNVLSEHALTAREAEARYVADTPGLVALVLRVYHLARSYKFYDVAAKEGAGEFVPLPFDVSLDDMTPAVDDPLFEHRRSRILNGVGR